MQDDDVKVTAAEDSAEEVEVKEQEVQEVEEADELDTAYEAFWGSNEKQKSEIQTEESDDDDVKPTPNARPVEDIVREVAQRQGELSDYLSEHPELAPFKDTIRKVAAEPRMQGVKVESIVGAAIGFENAARIGAKAYTNRKATAEANRPEGSTARQTEETRTDLKPYDELSKEEKAAFRSKYRV